MIKQTLLLMLVLLLSINLISAQENITREAGITPDSPLWGLDRALERIRMAFTFGNQNRAEYGLKIAEERLSEIQQLQSENKTEGIEKALQERDRIMNQVQLQVNNTKTSQIKEQLNIKINLQNKIALKLKND